MHSQLLQALRVSSLCKQILWSFTSVQIFSYYSQVLKENAAISLIQKQQLDNNKESCILGRSQKLLSQERKLTTVFYVSILK